MFVRSTMILFLTVVTPVWGTSNVPNNSTSFHRKNESHSYNLQMKRLLCVDTPYIESEILECRTTLRRNQMPLLRILYHLPNVYNYIMIDYDLRYKFQTYQPFLINGGFEGCSALRGINREILRDPLKAHVLQVLKDMLPNIIVPCPFGNRTYRINTVFKQEYAPKSLPAGDYRLDLRFASKHNVTLLLLQGFFFRKKKRYYELYD